MGSNVQPEDIAGRSPVDRVAARVTSRSERQIINKVIQTADSETPLQIRRANRENRDLIGHRQGRLVVIGLSRHVPKRWVVRCDCGIYTLRTAKAMRNPCNTDDRCERCRLLSYLRKHDAYRRLGRYITPPDTCTPPPAPGPCDTETPSRSDDSQ